MKTSVKTPKIPTLPPTLPNHAQDQDAQDQDAQDQIQDLQGPQGVCLQGQETIHVVLPVQQVHLFEFAQAPRSAQTRGENVPVPTLPEKMCVPNRLEQSHVGAHLRTPVQLSSLRPGVQMAVTPLQTCQDQSSRGQTTKGTASIGVGPDGVCARATVAPRNV